MKKLWFVFIAIFVASFAVLGWVGTEIFRQAPPIPSEVVTTDGRVLVSGDDKYLYVADNNNNTKGGARKLWRFDLRAEG